MLLFRPHPSSFGSLALSIQLQYLYLTMHNVYYLQQHSYALSFKMLNTGNCFLAPPHRPPYSLPKLPLCVALPPLDHSRATHLILWLYSLCPCLRGCCRKREQLKGEIQGPCSRLALRALLAAPPTVQVQLGSYNVVNTPSRFVGEEVMSWRTVAIPGFTSKHHFVFSLSVGHAHFCSRSQRLLFDLPTHSHR